MYHSHLYKYTILKRHFKAFYAIYYIFINNFKIRKSVLNRLKIALNRILNVFYSF